ncbi:metal ABC transporter solute-binding protein, Zn/Mn family [Rhodoplanes azumiensis]|uniref:Metal ABC transporter solute-binding protein, Zn/Mn family n=1 Tax=Rhodoplanes azumiensis TaxID=1897628 RepID=A0ABW5AKA3_9BRAD
MPRLPVTFTRRTLLGTLAATTAGLALVAALAAPTAGLAQAAGEAGTPADVPAAAVPVRVVASFSILGDLVKQVGGPLVAVDLLVGPNADMHAFQPSPADSKKLAGAKLVVINGLGLEGWVERMTKASGYTGPVVVAAKGLKPIAKPKDSDHGHGHGHDHDHGKDDPHAWQSVANVKLYVGNIRDGLTAVDPANKATYAANADAYLKQLDALERDIVAAFEGVPKDMRTVITAHQAFRYYGAAYGITFRAAKGVTEDSEPSAREIADLIKLIKKEKVRALFVENISNRRLLDRIAKETDAKVGGTLFSDALSEPSGAAPTYVDMMRANTKALADALKG